MVKVKLQFTKKDIEISNPGDCDSCLIATSLNKQLRSGFHASVYSDGEIGLVRNYNRNVVYLIPATDQISKIVKIFDDYSSDSNRLIGKTCTLEIPDQYLKEGVIK
jgi:hypothetical protein